MSIILCSITSLAREGRYTPSRQICTNRYGLLHYFPEEVFDLWSRLHILDKLIPVERLGIYRINHGESLTHFIP